jgi:hypothetical protein
MQEFLRESIESISGLQNPSKFNSSLREDSQTDGQPSVIFPLDFIRQVAETYRRHEECSYEDDADTSKRSEILSKIKDGSFAMTPNF